MKFRLVEEFTQEDKYNKILKDETNNINRWLDKYGFEIDVIDDLDLGDIDWEDNVGVFLNSIQDNASIFPIALNKKEILNYCKNDITELTYAIRGTLWHEAGHGIFNFLNDVYNLDDLDEEETVEEFARYQENSELYDILQDYENQDQLEENYQNSELSGEYDSEGNELTKSQVSFFKNSKVRDKNGRLLVCYHGSSAEFDIFEESRIKTGTFGNGFYFTTSKKSATRYGKTKGYYLNIKNIIEIPVKYENIIEFVIDKYNGNDNINTKESTQIIKENGYDGVMTKMYYGDDNFEYYIAFYPNQIKSITNKNPSSRNYINENMLNEAKADTEKFRQWLLNVETNTSKAKDLFDWFEQNRRNLKSPQNDYYYWMKQSNSQDAINELTELTIKGKDRKVKKEVEKEGANLIYKDNEWYVYKITNYEASCKIGANTKWCITGTKRWGTSDADGKKYWDEYTEKGITIYFFIDRKNNKKYAIAVYPNKTFEIFDEEDLEISFIPNAPQIKEIGVNYWDRDDKKLLQYLLMENKLPKQFTLEMFENLLSDKIGKYEQDVIITLTDNKKIIISLLENYIPDGYIENESVYNDLLTPEEYKKITGMEFDYDLGWGGDVPPFDFATLSKIQNDYKTKEEICSIENPFIKNNKYWLVIDTYEVKFDGFDSYERLIRDGIFPYADTDTFKEFLDICSDTILKELKKQKNKKYIEDIVKLGVSQQYLTGKINENFKINNVEIDTKKIDLINKKPINELTLDDIIYIYSFNTITDDWWGEDEDEFVDDLNYYIEKYKKDTNTSKEFQKCLSFCKSLKLPLTLYRSLNSDEINSNKILRLSWTTDINIFKNNKSKFKNAKNIVKTTINDYAAIFNDLTVTNFMNWSTNAFSYRELDYPEHEVCINPKFVKEFTFID